MGKLYRALNKNSYKIVLIVVLIIISCLLLYYLRPTHNKGNIFTHFAFIPVILSAIWWPRKSIGVPLFFGLVIILCPVLVPSYEAPINQYMNAIVLLVLFFAIALLSDRVNTEKKQAQHINRILEATRRINQSIVQATDYKKFINDVCSQLVETRGYLSAWIVMRDKGETLVTAEAGLSERFPLMVERLKGNELTHCRWDILWAEELKVIKDPVKSCTNCPLAEEYKGNSTMICQLVHNDHIYGLLSVSAHPEVISRKEEQDLFRGLCQDTAFGLYKLEIEEEQKKIETKLIQSEQKFRQLAEQSPNIIFIYKKGKVAYLNARSEEITGYDREYSYRPGFDYIDIMVAPEHKVMLRRYFRKQRTEKDMKPVEYTFITKDGRRINAILNTQLIEYEGEPSLLGVITDISTLKKTEQALRESERRFKETVELLPQAVYECDITGKLTFVNRKAMEYFGYTENDLNEQLNILQTIAPKDRDRARENVTRIFSGEIINGMEYTALRKDGSTFPITIYSSLITHDDKPAGIRGIIIDNTQRKQMEKDLELKALMLDMSIDPIMICDFEGNITYTNEATSQLTGYPVEKLLEMKTSELLQEESQGDIEKAVTKLKQKGNIKLEFIGLNADGSRTLLDTSLRIIQSVNDTMVLCAAHDITRRVKIENALQQLNNELEQRIERRTRKLMEVQEQLLRQEKLVLLGQLAGGVSHELRNPLGVIRNTTYFLSMVLDKSNPEIREALGILDKEVMNSEHIIKSLLDFANPGPITREETSINNVIYDTVNSISIPDTIEVVYKLDKNLRQVKADVSKLDQIFRNVILNAVQAMSEGGKITIVTGSEDSKWVTISITDTGIGINKENLNNIFEPLFTTKAKGIGLGLAYTKILIEEHKGTIAVQSKMGKGSTFTIRIPIESETTDAKKLYEEKN